MADDTECAVCFEEFQTPKILPCNHTFCLKCLEKLELQKRITCPKCSKKHNVPDRGAQSFMENPHAMALVAAKKVSLKDPFTQNENATEGGNFL